MLTDSFVCQGLHGIQGVGARGLTYERIGLDEISHLGKDAAASACFVVPDPAAYAADDSGAERKQFFRRIDFGCQLYNVLGGLINITTNEDSNKGLFWALKVGEGGIFGVVTTVRVFLDDPVTCDGRIHKD
ncbi:hypothetical protein E4U24_002882 [Claviceps purpurea]|nr:hypothetical protein E4U11_006133 [Claviceps purpurea]KAG6247996.1 hypothetical protein E4U24_002882 [Claviceps purpurea]